MNKLTFRARQLDASKPMPVYKDDEIPELPDMSAINRAVPQMPTGMESEEETEHHIQAALSAQQVCGRAAHPMVIPCPEIDDDDEQYTRLYGVGASEYKIPKSFIHVQPSFGMDHDVPEYDCDTDDDTWLKERKLDCTPLKFETMMDRLEKGSGQVALTLGAAKTLLKEDDDLIIAVYDYWLGKRLHVAHELIPSVRAEKRDGTTSNNPYVAFRRRTEKMQTRKNRKNDEASYERMVKLQRDMKMTLTLLEYMKKREKCKKEILQLSMEVNDKRYQTEDWDGKVYNEATARSHSLPPTYIPPLLPHAMSGWGGQRDEVPYTKKAKREYKKHRRQHKTTNAAAQAAAAAAAQATRQSSLPQYNDVDILGPDYTSDDDNNMSPQMSASDPEVDDDPDGNYAFKRKPGVSYNSSINNGYGNWPWHGPDEGGVGEPKYRYNLASLPGLDRRYRCVGLIRQRKARGGRIVYDRLRTAHDDYLLQTNFAPDAEEIGWGRKYRQHVKDHHIHHYRPKTPTEVEEDAEWQQKLRNGQTSSLQSFQSPASPMDTAEPSIESFKSHQDQLFERHQREQSSLIQDNNQIMDFDLSVAVASNPAPNKFTVDASSAVIAASAAYNSETEFITSSEAATCTTTLTVSQPSSVTSSVTSSSLATTFSTGAVHKSVSSPALISLNSSCQTVPSASVSVSSLLRTNSMVPISSGGVVVSNTPQAVKSMMVKHNGPLMDHNRANVFSTSPAANVYQLNFPMQKGAATTSASASQSSAPAQPSSSSSTQQHPSSASTTSLISRINAASTSAASPIHLVSASGHIYQIGGSASSTAPSLLASGPPQQQQQQQQQQQNTVYSQSLQQSKLAAQQQHQQHQQNNANTVATNTTPAGAATGSRIMQKTEGSTNGSNTLLKAHMEVT